eukprot:CFRG4497T1
MKNRYGSLDLAAAVSELQKYQGLRISNIYDVDAKTYLFKMQQSDRKGVILLESGVRIHSTEYEWPKSQMPSNFSMKMRKHLRSKRLESIKQLGVDRVIDMEFGYGEACYHLLVEFYSKGNIVLTNHEYEILNILRPRTHRETSELHADGKDATENGDVRIAVGEKYPFQLTKQEFDTLSDESLRQRLSEATTVNLKKALAGFIDFSPPVAEHCLREAGINVQRKVVDFDLNEGSADVESILIALQRARTISTSMSDFKGYIIQRQEGGKKGVETENEPQLFYDEFHPILYAQHTTRPYVEYPTFNQAVDEFFSKKESQKLDQQAFQQERSVMKKLENLQLHHKQAVEDLQAEQEKRNADANLIEMNLQSVDAAIQAVNSLVATGMSWNEAEDMVDEARVMGDPVAETIVSLNLKTNRIVLALSDIYAESDGDDDDKDPVLIEIDLAQNAFGNACTYHSKKKQAKEKEKRTEDTSKKAIKSVEKSTKLKVKELQLRTEIAKSRKVLWFEKFLWFISSENYLVIAGRDAQQNELLVKKYFKNGDIYVHADLHGAATCIIKNHAPTEPIPPKTLTEAGAMAICSSAAWEAKVVISAYWVHHSQVSKTAPTGEYLTTGSFMVRGKKNFLPPAPLVLGFGILFRVDDECVSNHIDERKVNRDEKVASSALDYERRSHLKQDTQRRKGVAVIDADNEIWGVQDVCEDECAGESVKDEHKSDKENGSNDDDCANDQSCDESDLELDDDDVEYPETDVGLRGYSTALVKPRTSGQVKDDDSEGGEDDSESNVDAISTSKHGTGYVTAKQRRVMKKKGIALSDIKKGIYEDIREDEREMPTPKPKVRIDSVPVIPRGKRTKMKRAKAKYADQDEDDKELYMSLLKSTVDEASTAKNGRKDKKGKKGKDQAQKHIHNKGRGKQLANKGSDRESETQKKAQSEKIQYQPSTTAILEPSMPTNFAVATPVDNGVQKDKADEHVDQEPDMDLTTEVVSVLNTLTGQPRADDMFMFAMAYCAPYSSMQNFKYKVKALPGTQKKGKASKHARDIFIKSSDVPIEKDLIRAIGDNELTLRLPSKVKISNPAKK